MQSPKEDLVGGLLCVAWSPRSMIGLLHVREGLHIARVRVVF